MQIRLYSRLLFRHPSEIHRARKRWYRRRVRPSCLSSEADCCVLWVVQAVRVVQAVSANTYTHRVRERGAGEREMEREGI